MVCLVPMDDAEAVDRDAGEDWVDEEGNPCPGSKYAAETPVVRRKIPKGKIDYAKYEARRKNIIAMLRAQMLQEVLHYVTVGGKGVDPYETAKRIHGWTVSHLETALDEGFLVPLSPEDPPLGEDQIRALYIQAAEEVISNVP